MFPAAHWCVEAAEDVPPHIATLQYPAGAQTGEEGVSSPVTRTRTRTEEETACIEVIDNGKGIQPRNLEQIFDRFFQESASRLAVGSGADKSSR